MKRYRLTVMVQGAPDLNFYGLNIGPLLKVARTQLLDTSRWKVVGAIPIKATLAERDFMSNESPEWKTIRVITPKDAVQL